MTDGDGGRRDASSGPEKRADAGSPKYVGRGGSKLRYALEAFALDVQGRICADFGCNVGGFTDCLLQAGAAHVFAVDTGYGVLDYRLRVDPRVTVMERTNALHADPPEGGVHLVVIDMGWTIQRHCVPAALRWLRKDDDGARIVTLIKPHYERSAREGRARDFHGVLKAEEAEAQTKLVLEELANWGARVLASVRSPILGGASRGLRSGNVEYLALLAPV